MTTETSVPTRGDQSAAPSALVVSLRDTAAADVASAGGKGANLAVLLDAGFAVPPGFVVTTAAYRLAAGGQPGGPGAVPTDLAEKIAAAYAEVGGGAVAVRSSATTEDLAGATFAGQHETILNVVGKDALLAAVLECWASLWSPHAVDYRRWAGLDTADVAMAVVVQRMVEAAAAGVLFTADPVTGRRDHVVVDATRGLGEALVSGRVTPDHYVLRKRGGGRLEFRAGRGELTITAAVSGGTTEGPPMATGPVLRRRQLAELARTGARIEAVFGAPQDIEWAYTEERLWVVQARPMTALPAPAPRPLSRRRRLGAIMLSELMPLRPYPIDATLWFPAIMRGVDDFMSEFGVHLKADSALVVQDGVVEEFRPVGPQFSPLVPLRVIASMARGDSYSREALLADPRMRRMFAEIAAGRRTDLGRLSAPELKALLDTGISAVLTVLHVRRRFMGRAALAAGRLAVALVLLRRTRLLASLLSGAETMTARANADLRALARKPDRTAADVQCFLDEHGHRETALLLVSQPCWADDPAAVDALLTAAAGEPPTLGDGPARARAELLRHRFLRRPAARRAVERLIDSAQPTLQWREDTHYYATYGMPLVRRVLLEYGRRLHLDAPEDVFHLTADELATERLQPEWLREVVARRKARRVELDGRPLIDARVLQPVAAGENALLRGSAGSAGIATGPVRVVRGPAEFGLLRDGEVLVAPYTNPSWTPLFALAAAVVADAGSVGSHAAIVAREYGIPAILGTQTATTTLTDGQVVTVDGTRGLVREGAVEG